MCLMDEELRSVVNEAKSTGWTFINEGTVEKPKVKVKPTDCRPSVLRCGPPRVGSLLVPMGSRSGAVLVNCN